MYCLRLRSLQVCVTCDCYLFIKSPIPTKVSTINIARYKGSLNQIEFFATLTRIPTLKHCIQSKCAAVLNLILKRREISLTYFEPVRWNKI